MANKTLFKTTRGRLAPNANTKNEAGGAAYTLTNEQALAQYAVTGCLNDTFYADAGMQLDTVLAMLDDVDPAFVAKVAVYARKRGYMKDMPAVLTAWLATYGGDHFSATFGDVIDNGKMLRNFVQIMRSGALGRKSLGSRPKRLVQDWLNSRTDEQLIAAMVGNNPSLADVIKMVHPKPNDKARDNLYAYIIGRAFDVELLPEELRVFEAYKKGNTSRVPKVPFQMLTALDLGQKGWIKIAKNAPWQMTRMNLNTFARHDVFKAKNMHSLIASRLADESLIRKARVFPYQVMSAYTMTADGVPEIVRDALHDAMQIALANVPKLKGQVYVFPDVSGSMQSPVTGYRQGATTAVRCVDVAALVAAAVMAKNHDAVALPFDTRVHKTRLSRRDSIMTNAQKLAALGGWGTDCALPLQHLNKTKATGDILIYVSDNESWAGMQPNAYRKGTGMMEEWLAFKARNPNAKLVCIDIQPYTTVQAVGNDVLHVGGFSDAVFDVIAAFANGELGSNHWVDVINKQQ